MFSKTLFCLLPLAFVMVMGEDNLVVNVPADQENPLELKDIVISDNTVGGDINVNAGDGGNGHSHGGDEGFGGDDGGSESFDDGCSVVGDTVHECDGTQRLMTRVEKKKVTARIARRSRQRKAKGANRSRANRAKTARRDVEDGEDGEESPCQSCSTGASYAKKNNKKNNAKKNVKKNAKKSG